MLDADRETAPLTMPDDESQVRELPTVRGSAATDALGVNPGLRETLRSFSDLSYRDLFWPARKYEDLADRLALRAFLPPTGARVIEVGAGFGRLSDEYGGYGEVVLLDPSDVLLDAARSRLGGDPRFTMVSGEADRLPFSDASFDAATCVRVIHHLENPQTAILEFARILRPGGVLVLESANKRNLKAVMAYGLRRGGPSPFTRGSTPYREVTFMPGAIGRPFASEREDASLAAKWSATTSFRHAPEDLRSWLGSAGFEVKATRSVGLFRLPSLTRRMPLGLLIALERYQQTALAPVTPGPSLFIQAVRRADATARPAGRAPR